ncbi:MAG TPA: carboxypeptidase-like regulatory domain-containing protein, partial [Thermoanaerobaculia bacterium]|nr:carboxypeptidase-like regulatory domain-containing protein [Thermoanaerobaculia bacterium]
GPDGRFAFAGIKYGRQTLRVFPAQHLEPEPIVFTLDPDRRLQNLDVKVSAGRSVPVIVIDQNDDPVAKAVVLAVTEAEVRARTATDEDGRASIAVPPGQPATLFVIPEEGLFAIHRLPAKEEPGRLKIYLPRASSSLLIRATTLAGDAMPRFSLLMRYNGELVPMEVAEALTVVQGLQLQTGPGSEAHLRNIPSGSYEFWPYRTEAEAESIITAASAMLAPIQVDVRTGQNKIAVKFAAR